MNWIPLCKELPMPNEAVFWYDAMFDNMMYFALEDPAIHDPDFSHFARKQRPGEYEATYGSKEISFLRFIM